MDPIPPDILISLGAVQKGRTEPARGQNVGFYIILFFCRYVNSKSKHFSKKFALFREKTEKYPAHCCRKNECSSIVDIHHGKSSGALYSAAFGEAVRLYLGSGLQRPDGRQGGDGMLIDHLLLAVGHQHHHAAVKARDDPPKLEAIHEK
jgi:hypothetical protein